MHGEISGPQKLGYTEHQEDSKKVVKRSRLHSPSTEPAGQVTQGEIPFYHHPSKEEEAEGWGQGGGRKRTRKKENTETVCGL